MGATGMSAPNLFVGIESCRCADLITAKAPSDQQFGCLALLCPVQGSRRAEPTPHQFAGDLVPVAIETFHGRRYSLAVETMRSQLGTDPQRTETGGGPIANEAFSEAAVVLPTSSLELLDSGVRILAGNAACPELACKFPFGMFTPDQQSQGTLCRRGFRPSASTRWHWLCLRLGRRLDRARLFHLSRIAQLGRSLHGSFPLRQIRVGLPAAPSHRQRGGRLIRLRRLRLRHAALALPAAPRISRAAPPPGVPRPAGCP